MRRLIALPFIGFLGTKSLFKKKPKYYTGGVVNPKWIRKDFIAVSDIEKGRLVVLSDEVRLADSHIIGYVTEYKPENYSTHIKDNKHLIAKIIKVKN